LPICKRRSRYGGQALRNSAKPFHVDLRSGKEFLKIALAEQAQVAEIVVSRGSLLKNRKRGGKGVKNPHYDATSQKGFF
jgi:hypothetical protein